MSIKSKVAAAAAAVTLVGGFGAVAASTADLTGAATPSCGNTCINVFSKLFGTHRHPNFVMDVWRQSAKVGQPIILFRSSLSDPAEDFNASLQGTANDFFNAGLVSAAVNLHYGGGAVGFPNDPAFELEYTPYGVGSGLCVGVFPPLLRAPRSASSRVALRPRRSGSWTPSTPTSPVASSR